MGKFEQQPPFDPHSVQSAVSVEEQKKNREMRELLAKRGSIPPESVLDTGGIDINNARAPQYRHRDAMQGEMDNLAREAGEQTQGTTPKEFRDKLKALVDKLSGKSTREQDPEHPELM